MGRKIFQRSSAIVLVFVIFLGLVWTSCSSTVKERREERTRSGEIGATKFQAGYYHFNDVLVPGELKYKQSKSFIYETPQFKTGVMVFSKWRLDTVSLIDFFTYNMEKDHWILVNSFRGKESVINFSKPDRTCTIKITENWYGMTEVEIRVGPLGEKKM